jgi:hypothetical protein
MPETEVSAEAMKHVVILFGIEWSHYLLCGIGAFVFFFKLQHKGSPIFEVIGYINPRWKDHPICRFPEAVLFSVLGTIIGTIITHPSNAQQAIAAGLGWTGILTKSATT